MKTIVLQPGEARRLGGHIAGVKVASDEADERFCVLEARLGAEPGPRLHRHNKHVESWFVVAGELEILSGNERISAPAGSFVLIPPSSPHTFANLGPGEAHMLSFHAPGGLDRFFVELVRLRTAEDPGFKAVATLFKRYDTEPADENEPPDPPALVVGPGEGEQLSIGGGTITILADSAATGGRFAVVDYTAPPGFPGPPPHRHREIADLFYVLEGELSMKVDGDTVAAPAGTFVLVAPGTVHTFSNPSDRPARFLGIVSPGGFEQYFRDVAAGDRRRAVRSRGRRAADRQVRLRARLSGADHPARRAPREGEAITDKPDRELRLLCDHEWLTVTLVPATARASAGADPHVHRDHADGFYVLAGRDHGAARAGAASRWSPTAGTLVLIPPGVVHSFDNDGAEEARFLNFHAPDGGFANYLRTREDFDQFTRRPDGGRPASDAIVTPAGGGERFRREDRAITVLGDLPEISAMLLEVDPEWPGIGAHDHDDQVDTFFVLEGETGFFSGDDVVRAGPGTFYGAVPGVRHGVVHDGGRASFLNVHGPDAGLRRAGYGPSRWTRASATTRSATTSPPAIPRSCSRR